ncbi:extracellular solute-binding protein family 1 [Catenulispora acidiphila DSM 44928]|uniref:Extracellular solute-binding protein family 1 n=1 Tax=Catenulispora acidiphila (strain DSM 44928 / JCM 14897 / NBRC 102108 / NRRL B-24433 / ID139908) TaxID=479433 RepID=C7Q717_CATAD|nr:extracellular solute-binding protein [Catenulispora acidiphila]ACU76030.1 extracellular solute-binding protein family 1 [Catenulispora acidiphila DSM 44928]
MRIRTSAALAVGSVLVLGATACSSAASKSSGPAGSGSGTQPAAVAGAGSGAGKTLTVWYMDGDLSDAATKAINDKFTAATGAQVKVAIQQWDGINTKIATALAQDNPPDVIEIGNTDVPLFAASSGLTDITSALPQLQADQHWLPGLAGPATVDGHNYGAPLFAGNRAVIYNKKIWAAAGITAAPTTFAQLTADLDAIKAKNTAPDFSAFYFPGRYWYGAMQFVWDAGGQLASQAGGKWTGQLESPQAQQGLQAWKTFIGKYSAGASQDVDTTAPDFNTLFAQGKTATILNSNVNKILKVDPSLTDQIGTFPFPSATDGKTQPVFLGGSDLAVAAKSKNQALALAYLKAATDPAVQASAIVGIDHWIPASTEVIDQTISSLPDVSKAFFTAAKTSVATPAVAGWATIESDKSINDFFADIATGRKSPADAAKTLDAHLNQALNAPAQ